MPRSALTFVAAAAILCFVSESAAQNQLGGATFGGSRGFGGGLGGTSFGGTSFGAGGFGSSQFGGAFGGGQAVGQNAFGNANANQNAGYVGRGGETAFVGRGLGQTNANARFNQPRQASSGGEGGASSGASRRAPVRVRLRPSPELLAATRGAAGVPSALERPSRMAGVTARTQAGITVLEGVVDTPSQRLVAEKLMSLEPGVGAIENRLRLRSEAVELIPPPK